MTNKFLNNIKKLEKNINRLITNQSITYGLKLSLKKTLKEIKLYKSHTYGFNKINNLNTAKIQIGGGKHLLKNYLNIDITFPADFIWDVREGLPFEDECSELIFSEHFLEHIDYPVSVKKFINECFRILKPGGHLIIGVPDSELIIKNYYKKNNYFYKKIIKNWYSKRNFLPHINTYIDLINYHFRDQDNDDKYNPHLWAYDYEKFISLFKESGFKKIDKWRFNKKIANPKRKFGSLYVVAIK